MNRHEQAAQTVDNEAQLLAAARLQDHYAFKQLHARHYPFTYRVIRSMVNTDHEATELTQDVWIKIYDKLPGFREKSSFRTWAFTIARNTVRDFIRKKMRRKGIFTRLISHEDEDSAGAPEMAVNKETPRHNAEQNELHQRFNAALALLPEKQRLAFVLYEREDLSYKEIAEVMHCKTGTVMSRLHQARQTLAARLAADTQRPSTSQNQP